MTEDFDDEALENQNAAEKLVDSIKTYLGQRCCVFLEADNYDDTCHGKLLAFIKDWPALMVRDLTPKRERLQRKRMIPLEVVRDMCFSPGAEKCKLCDVMRDLVAEGEKAEKENASGTSEA